ncbi:hypothetical protein ACJX0J_006256, partial [Zea mays]
VQDDIGNIDLPSLAPSLYPTNTHIAAWLFFVPRSLDLANYFLTSSDIRKKQGNYRKIKTTIDCYHAYSYLSKILQLRAASRNMANIVKIITTPKTAYDFEGHMLYVLLPYAILGSCLLYITIIWVHLNDKLCPVHLHCMSIALEKI